MYQITPFVVSKLRLMASQLPMVMTESHEKHIMTKAELEEMGYVGAEEMPDGTYTYKAPVQMAANHFRRLRKAYQKYGLAGCKDYVVKINHLMAKN